MSSGFKLASKVVGISFLLLSAIYGIAFLLTIAWNYAALPQSAELRYFVSILAAVVVSVSIALQIALPQVEEEGLEVESEEE